MFMLFKGFGYESEFFRLRERRPEGYRSYLQMETFFTWQSHGHGEVIPEKMTGIGAMRDLQSTMRTGVLQGSPMSNRAAGAVDAAFGRPLPVLRDLSGESGSISTGLDHPVITTTRLE